MKKLLIPAIVIATLLSACGNNKETDLTSDADVIDTIGVNGGEVTMAPTENGPEFPGAKLSVKDMTGVMKGTDSVEITINYNVSGYELKTQTPDATSRDCANSKDGQHIHFILDNGPYAALYMPTNKFTVAKNSEHTLLSFLSRSYHLSIKSPGAAEVYKFSVDDKGMVKKLATPTEPMVFYSRPKGDYKGADTKNVLLDFYVMNTTLAADGAKVKANINGGKDMMIDSWQPYFLQNLPMGKNTVKLTLVDKDGKDMTGTFGTVSRDFNLAKDEPMK